MDKLNGIFPALITPFDSNNRVDRAALRRVIEYNLQRGVSGFYACGSTGEALLMTKDERKELLEAAEEAIGGRALLLAHIGCFHTDDSIELARHAAALGVDAISSLPPFYYRFTLEELTRYYLDIVNAVPLPMIVYNAPALTGVSFDAKNIGPIFACEGVVGIKYTAYDLYQMQRMIAAHPDKIVINGHDEIFLPGMAAGSRSAIGSTFNFMADVFIRIRALFLENKIAEAAALQDSANRVIDVLIKVGVFRGVKGMLNVLGLSCGECRRPFLPLTGAEYKELEEALSWVKP
ncbi:MAG: N-acetylneuraminate lyase [Clostridiales bacterium]|nr:N-acetylneuraminate lyase [Clostridiales bacterium]